MLMICAYMRDWVQIDLTNSQARHSSQLLALLSSGFIQYVYCKRDGWKMRL